MWVERFGLCVGSNVRFAGVVVSLAPHQVRGDGKRARLEQLSPTSSGTRAHHQPGEVRT